MIRSISKPLAIGARRRTSRRLMGAQRMRPGGLEGMDDLRLIIEQLCLGVATSQEADGPRDDFVGVSSRGGHAGQPEYTDLPLVLPLHFGRRDAELLLHLRKQGPNH